MTRFSEVSYDEGHQTVTLGAGLIWDTVYAALAPHKVNVLGGRAAGIGVAGFILGGGTPSPCCWRFNISDNNHLGYSWKTNQYGLAIDTVVAFELVKPDGTIPPVPTGVHPNMFFGLKVRLTCHCLIRPFLTAPLCVREV